VKKPKRIPKGYKWIPRYRRRIKRGSSKRVSGGGCLVRKRPKGKKRLIGKNPVKLYPVYDEYGRRQGWSRKRK
jgi:hypothetical protein